MRTRVTDGVECTEFNASGNVTEEFLDRPTPGWSRGIISTLLQYMLPFEF